MTIGAGELTIIPSQEIGELGNREGAPTVFQWRWRYHFEGLAFWALILVPLVLVKANRNFQACAIMIPLMAVLIIFRMLGNLCSFSAANTEFLSSLVTSLAIAWAIIWLLAHCIFPRRGWLAIILALLVMGATGLFSCACNYGFTNDDTVVCLLLYYCVASCTLVLSVALTSRFRRKAELSKSYMAWLLGWTVLSSNLGLLMLFIGLELFQGSPDFSINELLEVLLFGSIGGIAIYLIHLVFMLLAFKSQFYHQRFRDSFGLQYAHRQIPGDILVQPPLEEATADEAPILPEIVDE